MTSPRLACLSTILMSTVVLLAQSNPLPLNQPLVPKNRVPSGLSQPDPATQGKILESYGKLPLSFEANQGQTDAKVKFLSRGSGYTLFLTGDEAVFSLRGSKAKAEHIACSRPQLHPTAVAPTTNAVLRMKLVKANPAAKVTGADELPGKSNYFIGNDPKKWRTNVPTYAKVKYEGIYPGIDLVYYGNQRQLEYDFVVAPGADPHRIQFDVRGAKSISRDEHGDLVLSDGDRRSSVAQAVVYQEKRWSEAGDRRALRHSGEEPELGFEVARYDLRRPLFIDPLVYSTYLGGSGDDNGIRHRRGQLGQRLRHRTIPPQPTFPP